MPFKMTVSLKILVTHRAYWRQGIFDEAFVFESFQGLDAKLFDYNFGLNESKWRQIVHKLNEKQIFNEQLMLSKGK